jgi:hypothetical protein
MTGSNLAYHLEIRVSVYRTIAMSAIRKDEGRMYIISRIANRDILGSIPHFFSIYPFADDKFLI